MPTSPQTPQSELEHAAKLDNKHRGELAELAFMRKATSRGLSIAKPWSDGERYDVIVRAGSICWRVQVKSVLAKSPCRDHYRIKTSGGTGRNRHTPYSASEIDFLVAYIFSEDLWYIFPASVVVSQTTVCLWPGSKKSRFEQYREAWHLMDPPPPQKAGQSAASILDL